MDIMIVKIEDIDKKVGLNIRVQRVKKGISQEEIADLSGIARSTMGIVERREQSPSLQTIAKIATAMKMDIYNLFLFDD